MKHALIFGGLVVAIMFPADGNGSGLVRSILHGFGWGLGREVAHGIVHHAFN